MPLCAPACAVKPPQIPKDCGVNIRPGGIRHLVFAACNIKFKNIKDLNEWATHVLRGDIVLSSPLMGQKPKGSFTKKRVNSCQPEVVVGIERSISFMDHNADLSGMNMDFAYYNRIQANPNLYQFGFITCDDTFYGFIHPFSIEVDLVIEETNNGNSFWDGTISWQGFDMIEPLYLPGLINVLQGQYASLPNFHPCEVASPNFYPSLITIPLAPAATPDPGLLPITNVDTFAGNVAGFVNLSNWQGITLSTDFVYGASYQWYYYPPQTPAVNLWPSFWSGINSVFTGAGNLDNIESISGLNRIEGATSREIVVHNVGLYAVQIKIPGCRTIVLAGQVMALDGGNYDINEQDDYFVNILPTTISFSDINDDGFYDMTINTVDLPNFGYTGGFEFAVIVDGVQSLWQTSNVFTGLPEGLSGTLLIRQTSAPYASRAIDFVVG